jgi:hypothetical protein
VKVSAILEKPFCAISRHGGCFRQTLLLQCRYCCSAEGNTKSGDDSGGESNHNLTPCSPQDIGRSEGRSWRYYNWLLGPLARFESIRFTKCSQWDRNRPNPIRPPLSF